MAKNQETAQAAAVEQQEAVNAEQGAAKKQAFVPKIIKHVTLPLLKPVIGQPIYVQITKAMYIGKDVSAKAAKPEDKKKAPATLVDCVNLETGELSQLIVPSVLKGIWEDDYPEDAYVGRGFAITKQEKREGKDYFPFSVAEIAVE